MTIRLRNVSNLEQGSPLFSPFHGRLLQDFPYPRCGAKRACGHERRSRMFPCLPFLTCRLLLTWQSHGGSCSRPTWHLVLKTGVRRARFRVAWDHQTLKIIYKFFVDKKRLFQLSRISFRVPRYPSCKKKALRSFCYIHQRCNVAPV
jgi:hypothetical protein